MGNTLEQWRAVIGRQCAAGSNGQHTRTAGGTDTWYNMLLLAALIILGLVCSVVLRIIRSFFRRPHDVTIQTGHDDNKTKSSSYNWQGAALDTTQTTFNKLPGTGGLGGQLFEIKLLSLIYLRALNLGIPFSMASNVKEYHKFDDVVFQFDQGHGNCFFLQLKHRENAEKRKITKDKLLTEYGDFSLRQYYKSYVNIQSNLKGKVGDNFENYLFVLYTNADVEEKLKNKQVPEIGGEKFLMTYPDRVLKFNQTEHSFIYQGLKALPRHVEFLSQLRVMYGQKAENEMDSLVKEELLRTDIDCSDVDGLYKLYHNQMQEWWLGNFRLTQQLDDNNPLTKAKHEMSTDRLGLRRAEISLMGIRFVQSALEELRDHIESNKVVVVYSPGKSKRVTTAKVHQVLSGKTKFLLVHPRDLCEHCDAILCNWKKGTFDVLVVEDINLEINIFKQIDIILCEGSRDRKLIIVAVEPDDCREIRNIRKVFRNQDFTELDDDVRLTDLEDETRIKLLGKIIVLQGAVTSMASLMTNGLESLGWETVSVLVENENVKVGNDLVQPLIYYIDRTLICNSSVTNDILTEKACVFAVLNTTKMELQKLVPPGESVCNVSEWHSGCRYVVVDDLQSFINLTLHVGNAHCLLRQGKRLRWIQSTGDLDTVRRHLGTDLSANCSPNTALDGEDRVILVTAEPGMGKSSLVTYLAYQTKLIDPAKWVVRVNLNAQTKTLHDIKINGFSLDLAVEMLAEAAGVEKSELGWKLFTTTLTSGSNMVVLLDGVDEVSPRYFGQVVQIVDWLCKTNVQKIWVTGRPHMKKQMEESFRRPTFSLKPFSVEDQKAFLMKFWGSKFRFHTVDVLKEFANNVIELANKSFGNMEKDMMGIPLQTFLLAEYFEKYIATDMTILPTLPQKINLYILYNEFVEKKWIIYNNEKKMAENTNVNLLEDNKILHEDFIQKHELAALVTILSVDEVSGLFNKKLLSDIDNIGIQRNGIVTGVMDGRPQFVHRTFAEYFAAMWFADHLQESRQLLSKHILTNRFQVVRRMLDHVLTEGYPVHLAAMNGQVDHLQCDQLDMLDKGGRTALHLAVMYRQPDVVRLLLDKGCDVSVMDNVLGWTSLQYATEYDVGVIAELSNARPDLREEVFVEENINDFVDIDSYLYAIVIRGLTPLLKYLVVDRRLDLNFRLLENKCTVLHAAAMFGQLEIVRWIISFVNNDYSQLNKMYESKTGKFVDITDRDGGTALHLASLWDQKQVVRDLLDAKCDCSIIDKSGRTALYIASERGHEQVVRELLAANCDCNVIDNRGRTALHIASERGHEQVVRELLAAKCDCNIADNIGCTSLHIASKGGHAQVVRELLAAKCDCNIIDNGSRTALHYASVRGHEQVVRELLAANCDCNVIDNEGPTALYISSIRGHDQMVRELVAANCDCNIINTGGYTALHHASELGHDQMVRELLAANCDCNIIDNEGRTALYIASIRGHEQVVRELLAANCDVSIANKFGWTAQFIASLYGHVEVANIIHNNGSDNTTMLDIPALLNTSGCDFNRTEFSGQTPLHIASGVGNVDAVEFLISVGCDMNITGEDGMSPLNIASRYGKVEVVRLLISAGCDMNITDKYGRTPLYNASRDGNVEIVRLLISAGCDVNITDKKRRTPLYAASRTGKVEVLRFLISAGCDINITDSDGNTPLKVARRNYNDRVADLLGVAGGV